MSLDESGMELVKLGPRLLKLGCSSSLFGGRGGKGWGDGRTHLVLSIASGAKPEAWPGAVAVAVAMVRFLYSIMLAGLALLERFKGASV